MQSAQEVLSDPTARHESNSELYVESGNITLSQPIHYSKHIALLLLRNRIGICILRSISIHKSNTHTKVIVHILPSQLPILQPEEFSSHPQDLPSRHDHPNQTQPINRIRQAYLLHRHTPPHHFLRSPKSVKYHVKTHPRISRINTKIKYSAHLNSIMHHRNPQTQHPSIIPPPLGPKIPRPEA